MSAPKPKPGYGGGFSPEVEEWLERRSAAFLHATQRKGQPHTYGTGKPEAANENRKAKKP